ncbi:MAG: Xaa-Pro dipeptidase [Gaiellaceae bacterium]|nr:Xaa-Pro dipeptidase [Gaiellaceae bacterium]
MIKGDTAKLRELMSERDLDALMAFSPGNMQYLVGYQAPALILKVMGAYSALLPANASHAPALVVGEFDAQWAKHMSSIDDVKTLGLWVEIEDVEALRNGTTTERPKREQFDWDQVFSHLRSTLRERDLLNGRVGCELESLPGYFRERLEAEFDDVTWVDASALYHEAAERKSPEEIAALRRSVELTETGLRASLLDNDPRGKTVSQLRNEFDLAVRAAVAADPELEGYQESRAFITCGGTIGPNVGRNATLVEDGCVIWIDCGVTVDGYQADFGRTIAVGDVDPLVHLIAEALVAGGQAGTEKLGIGVPMNEVFEATQAAIRANGLPTYTRGHFGHAIGVGGGEHHPFISPTETKTFEPGMAFAYERPFYVRGLGGFQFEDDFVVTENGIENLNSLPCTLLRV